MNNNRSGDTTPQEAFKEENMHPSIMMQRQMMAGTASPISEPGMNQHMQMMKAQNWYGMHPHDFMGSPRHMFYPQMPSPYMHPMMSARSMASTFHSQTSEKKEKDNTKEGESDKCFMKQINPNMLKHEISTEPTDAQLIESLKIQEQINKLPPGTHFHKDILPLVNSLGVQYGRVLKTDDDFAKFNMRSQSRTQTGVIYLDDKPVLQNIVSTCNLC